MINNLALFLADPDKRIANHPLLSTVKTFVFTLTLCCQVDHFVFRISYFASGKQLPFGIRPNENRI
jgi:hypothetical protein